MHLDIALDIALSMSDKTILKHSDKDDTYI